MCKREIKCCSAAKIRHFEMERSDIMKVLRPQGMFYWLSKRLYRHGRHDMKKCVFKKAFIVMRENETER